MRCDVGGSQNRRSPGACQTSKRMSIRDQFWRCPVPECTFKKRPGSGDVALGLPDPSQPISFANLPICWATGDRAAKVRGTTQKGAFRAHYEVIHPAMPLPAVLATKRQDRLAARAHTAAGPAEAPAGLAAITDPEMVDGSKVSVSGG